MDLHLDSRFELSFGLFVWVCVWFRGCLCLLRFGVPVFVFGLSSFNCRLGFGFDLWAWDWVCSWVYSGVCVLGFGLILTLGFGFGLCLGFTLWVWVCIWIAG